MNQTLRDAAVTFVRDRVGECERDPDVPGLCQVHDGLLRDPQRCVTFAGWVGMVTSVLESPVVECGRDAVAGDLVQVADWLSQPRVLWHGTGSAVMVSLEQIHHSKLVPLTDWLRIRAEAHEFAARVGAGEGVKV